MSLFPSQAVPLDDISFRARQPYVSSAGNRKFVGLPPGVYRGFLPQVDPFNNQRLLLNPDATYGDHVAMAEAFGGYGIHVRTTGIYALDFSGQPLADFPMYAYAEVGFVAPPTPGPTTATVKSVSIKTVAVINGLTPLLGDRVATADSGVVNPGALTVNQGDILQYDGVNWTFLFPTVVRLCRVQKLVLAGPISSADNDNSPGQTAITSDTFVPTNRQAPVAYQGVTVGFMPGGSIEQLLAAAQTTLEVNQGRTGLGIQLLGSATFTSGSANVTGDAFTKFLTEVQPGDLILAPDSTFKTVLSVTNDKLLILTAPYGALTATALNPTRNRTWPTLDQRLDNELSGSPSVTDNMARRLKKIGKFVEGTPRPAIAFPSPGSLPGWAASGSSANVSSDFRGVVPSIGGSKGAVVDPFDVTGNIVEVMDANYNEVGDSLNDFARVFGRLLYASQQLTGSAFTFNVVLGIPTLSATGSLFTAEVQPGDILQGVDGNFYTVNDVVNDLNLNLAVQLPTPPNGVASACERRRYVIQFKRFSGGLAGSEIGFTFGAGSAFRWSYHSLADASDVATYSDRILGRPRPGKAAPNIPDGTASLKGKVFAAISDGQAGSLRMVTTPTRSFDHIRQINFTAAASDPAGITNPSPGVLAISLVGPPGPIGPVGPGGGGGGVGPAGPGFSNHDYAAFSGNLPTGPITFGNSYAFTVAFAWFSIALLSAEGGAPADTLNTVTISQSGTTVSLGGSVDRPGSVDLVVGLRLGAAG